MTPTNGKYKITIEHRITSLEDKVSDLSCDIQEIKTNHLKHLQADVERIDSRTWWILGTVVLGVLVQILLKF